MSESPPAAKPAGILAKTARRVAVALTISIGVGLLMLTHWKGSPSTLLLRTILLGLSATAAFALFEAWPRKLPPWLQRWVLQVVSVGVFMPVTTLLIYMLPREGAPPFWEDPARVTGWTLLTFAGVLVAPWTALAAIVRQKEALRACIRSWRSRSSAVSSGGRRSTPVCSLLQAQVAPHFLFNTLANVQALVDAGSPQALGRAAEPHRLSARGGAAAPRAGPRTLERELQLVAALSRADADAHARSPAVTR